MVTVHIDRLVIQGIAPYERHIVAASLRSELVRLIEQRGIPEGLRSGGMQDVLSAAPSYQAAAGNPRQIGALAARSLYGTLNMRKR